MYGFLLFEISPMEDSPLTSGAMVSEPAINRLRSDLSSSSYPTLKFKWKTKKVI